MSHLELGHRTDTTDEAEQVLRHCRARSEGWETSLSAWLEQQKPWLQRRCAARLGNAFEAEDAVQEITLIVMKAVGQFEGRSQLRTWLTRIADNHCYQMRKRRAATAISDRLAFDIALNEEDRHETPEQTQLRAETCVEVRAVLSRLSTKNQEILSLRFGSEHSLEELSHLLNLSLSAAKMRLYRAMDAFERQYSMHSK